MVLPKEVVRLLADVRRSMLNQPQPMHDSSWRIKDFAIIKGSARGGCNTRTRQRKCGRGY